MRATLSILGLYSYYPELFDGMSFPEKLEKDVFIEQLLFETAELEVLYSNPEFMKAALNAWSKAQLPIWTKLYESTILEFNPLWNKDAYYEETEREVRDLSDTHNTKDTGTIKTDGSSSGEFSADGSSSTSGSYERSGDQRTNVAGFNSNDEALRDRITNTDNGYNSETGTSRDRETSSGSSSETETLNTKREESGTDTGTIERSHTRREYGNIGVTTSTALLSEYRDYVKFNIYDKIIDDFKKRFCILVY